MLELRPNCEHCGKALAPDSTAAMICTFECTFCRPCVEGVLQNVCPNCGGGFCQRPVRPRFGHRNGNCLGNYPASTTEVLNPVDEAHHAQFAAKLTTIPPQER